MNKGNALRLALCEFRGVLFVINSKPFILQELLGRWSASRIELHDAEQKCLVRVRDFLRICEGERRHSIRGALLHEHRDDTKALFIGDFLVGRRERPKDLMVLYEDLGVEIIVVDGDVWVEDVEVVSVDQTDEL